MGRVLHAAGELLALAFAMAVGFYAVILVMMNGLAVFATVVAGCLAVVLVAVVVRGRWLRLAQSSRTLFDLFLVSLVPAAVLTGLAFQLRWPIRTRGGDAHGWGTTGGEANVLFLPWLHAASFLALAVLWMRSARRYAR